MITDDNDNGNRNSGLRALTREMSATNERLAAWIYRGLLAMVSVGFVITSWFVVDKLSSFDKKFDALDASRQSLGYSLTRLETSLTDYNKNQDRIITQLLNQQQDHELRLRQLERLPR